MRDDEVEIKFKILKDIVETYGYKIIYDTTKYHRFIGTGNYVDHGRKVIGTMPKITVRELIGICHELGHIVDRHRTGKKRNRKNYIVRLCDEIIAWIYAIPFAHKVRLPAREFMKDMLKCLYTYVVSRKVAERLANGKLK